MKDTVYYTIAKSMKPPSDMALKKKCFSCGNLIEIFQEDSDKLIVCEDCSKKIVQKYGGMDYKNWIDESAINNSVL